MPMKVTKPKIEELQIMGAVRFDSQDQPIKKNNNMEFNTQQEIFYTTDQIHLIHE